MKSKDLFYQDLQDVFKYYLKNDSYLKCALDSLKKYERRSFIGSILSYEYQNLVENCNLEFDEKDRAVLPKNLITLLTYDRHEFDGEILKNFVEDLKCELECIEMELYDDPVDFEGGDYYDEDSDCDEDYTIEEWVEDLNKGDKRFFGRFRGLPMDKMLDLSANQIHLYFFSKKSFSDEKYLDAWRQELYEFI